MADDLRERIRPAGVRRFRHVERFMGGCEYIEIGPDSCVLVMRDGSRDTTGTYSIEFAERQVAEGYWVEVTGPPPPTRAERALSRILIDYESMMSGSPYKPPKSVESKLLYIERKLNEAKEAMSRDLHPGSALGWIGAVTLAALEQLVTGEPTSMDGGCHKWPERRGRG
jgi:hypothetical protein